MSDSFVTPWTVAYQGPLSMGWCFSQMMFNKNWNQDIDFYKKDNSISISY